MLARTAVAVLIASLTACAVGPDYQQPAPPAAHGYGGAPSRGQTSGVEATAGGNVQQFVEGMDIPMVDGTDSV